MQRRAAPIRSPGIRPGVWVFGVIASLLVSALLLAGQSVAPGLVRLEHVAGDLRTALLAHPTSRQHGEVVVVTVDEAVLARFAGHNYRTPTDRAVLARIVRAVDRAGPRAIGLDFIFDRPTEREKDDALIAALRTATSRIVLGVADERAGLTPDQRTWQAAFLAASEAEAGHVSLTYDRDDVVRYLSRPAAGGPYRAGFAEQLARDVPPPADRADVAPIVPMSRDDYRQHRIAWLRVEDYAPDATFRTLPALALLDAETREDGRLAAALGTLLRGKTVLIGGVFPGLDEHRTPFSALGAPKLPGVMIHAHVFAQIVDRRSVTHAPPWTEPIAILALTLLGFAVGVRWEVEKFVYLIGMSGLIVLDAAIFFAFAIVMPFTLPLFGWLAGAWLGRNHEIFVGRRPERELPT